MVHQWRCSREHLDLDVDTGGLLDKLAFLVQLGGLLPLFHLLAHACDLDDDVLVVDVVGNAETALDVAHLDCSPSNAAVTLCVVLFHFDFVVFASVGRVKQRLFVQFLRFDSVALVLDLRGELSADVLFFLRRNLLCELESLEPVLQVHAHF